MEIRPLTLLAGINSSGKSSSVQPLLILKQTLDVPYDPGALLLDGGNVKFTNAAQLLSRIPPRAQEFTVGIELDGRDLIKPTYHHTPKRGFDVQSMVLTEGGNTYRLKPGSVREEEGSALFRNLPFAGLVGTDISAYEFHVQRSRCFLMPGFVMNPANDITQRFFIPGSQVIERAQVYLRNLVHVPALRGNPQRLYPTTAVTPPFPSRFDTYVASIIAEWQRNGDRRLERLQNALLLLGLTWKITSHDVNETQVELLVGRLPKAKRGGAGDVVNITDVGFGLSQSLPVLVALLVGGPGQVIYIEEPEIHLHPMAQYHLATLVAEASNRGAHVVIETHSSLLLRGIQTLIARGEISRHAVALHWFSRSPEGETQISTAEVESDGAFGNWPVDFDEVTLAADRAYLEAGI